MSRTGRKTASAAGARPTHLGRRSAAVAVALSILLAACSGGSGDDAGPEGPADPTSTTTAGTDGPGTHAGGIGEGGVDEWPEVEPAEVGLDPEVLDGIAASAESGGSTCLLVSRHGRIAGEWYWGSGAVDDPREIFSASKSITSILVGIAADRGDLSIDDLASSYIPSWLGTPSEDVTIANLLANDSGRFWSIVSDYFEMVQSPNRTEYAIGLDQADPPGTTWAYNNAAIQTLSEVVSEATGTPFAEFGEAELLEPLGMDDTSFSPDGDRNALAFMGVQSTCRDLARFGRMLLLDGTWNGEQVVSADYVEQATGSSSQDLNAAYGNLFWLNREGPLAGAIDPTRASETEERPSGRLVEDRPEDLVWALGLGGQIVQIHAPTDTVVVRLGPGDLAPEFSNEDTARVLDAVED